MKRDSTKVIKPVIWEEAAVPVIRVIASLLWREKNDEYPMVGGDPESWSDDDLRSFARQMTGEMSADQLLVFEEMAKAYAAHEMTLVLRATKNLERGMKKAAREANRDLDDVGKALETLRRSFDRLDESVVRAKQEIRFGDDWIDWL